MKAVAAEMDSGIDDYICEVINGEDFKNELVQIITNLDPICKLINKCQDPSANVADATQMWLELHLPCDEYNDLIAERIEKAVWPVGYAANYLHHKYKGQLLNEDQLSVAQTFLYEHLNEEGLEELGDFESNRDSFEYLAENSDDPLTFWSLCRPYYKHLAEFARSILVIPASTAKIEGMFSEWTFVHNKYRNRLGNLTSAQLIDIFHYLNMTGPKHHKKPKRKRLLLSDDDGDD